MTPRGWILPEQLSGREKQTPMLLAFSGGADSSLLFHLLLTGGYNFEVAHVNHGIRGAEADRDEIFCRSIAEGAGVKFHLLRADIPKVARKTGESVEAAARRVRYSFFADIMRARNIPLLLTAHNADDNAETLIISLVRGCSPSGACGIPHTRPLEYGEVIRPLIRVSKEDILAFCKDKGILFVTDSTNSDTSYLRNSVRAEIIPRLKELSPALLDTLSRFCESQREETEYLDGVADRAVKECGGVPDVESLRALDAPIAKRILLAAAYRAGASPEHYHAERMLELVGGECTGVTLPGGVCVSVRDGRIVFSPEDRRPSGERRQFPEFSETSITVGENRANGTLGTIVCSELTKDYAQIYNLSTSVIINLDRIKGQLYITPRREGDRYCLRGMHRQLRKLLCARWRELSPEERRMLPVLRDDDGIVWAPGLEPADGKEYKGQGQMLIIGYGIGI